MKHTFQNEPFAYSALKDYDGGNQVSIITQFKIEQLSSIAVLADIWKGPISASILINDNTDVDKIFKVVRNSLSVCENVDIHFLYTNNNSGSYGYPINNLLNLAISNSRTEWVLELEIDNIPSYGMFEQLNNGILNEYDNGVPIVYIIPSFETSSLDRYELPDSKDQLIEYLNNNEEEYGNLITIDNSKQEQTDYSKWYKLNEPYISHYLFGYEPIILFKKSTIIIDPFDERIKIYGNNGCISLYKTLNTFKLAISGFKFLVLPNVWVTHLNQSNIYNQNENNEDQMFDSYKIACNLILPDIKQSFQKDLKIKIYNEPLQFECAQFITISGDGSGND